MNTKNILTLTALSVALALTLGCAQDATDNRVSTGPAYQSDRDVAAEASQIQAEQNLDQAQYEASQNLDQAGAHLSQAGDALGDAAVATGQAAAATTEAAAEVAGERIARGAEVTAEQAGRAKARIDNATEPLQDAFEQGKQKETQELRQEGELN